MFVKENGSSVDCLHRILDNRRREGAKRWGETRGNGERTLQMELINNICNTRENVLKPENVPETNCVFLAFMLYWYGPFDSILWSPFHKLYQIVLPS